MTLRELPPCCFRYSGISHYNLFFHFCWSCEIFHSFMQNIDSCIYSTCARMIHATGCISAWFSSSLLFGVQNKFRDILLLHSSPFICNCTRDKFIHPSYTLQTREICWKFVWQDWIFKSCFKPKTHHGGLWYPKCYNYIVLFESFVFKLRRKSLSQGNFLGPLNLSCLKYTIVLPPSATDAACLYMFLVCVHVRATHCQLQPGFARQRTETWK